MEQRLFKTTTAVLAVITVSGCLNRESAVTNTQPMSSALSPDEQLAVRAVVAGFADTWNRHDMNAMHALDTDDVEWINVTGNHWRGKAAVYKGHDNIHRTIFAKTQMNVLDTSTRPIAPGVALVVATMMFSPVITPLGQLVPDLKSRGTFTVVRRDGVWKIVHFQNTSVDPDAEKDDPITWDETGFLPGKGVKKPD